MGRADYLELGDYNAACSMCGRKRKASTMVRNWQGQYRCWEHNEQRQPQDFVRGVPDIVSVPWSQPELDSFTAVCTLAGISAVPGLAIPGCMLPGRRLYPLTDGYGNITGELVLAPLAPLVPPITGNITADGGWTADSGITADQGLPAAIQVPGAPTGVTAK